MQHQASIVQHSSSPVLQANAMRTRAHYGLRDLFWNKCAAGVYTFLALVMMINDNM